MNLKISIVTVSYNAAKTIEQTIQSVVCQKYDNIEYIIIDGGSTDGTVDIIKKYEDKIAYWVSEPDNGMYDALVKGFQHISGDICAYINADDFYQPGAFGVVAEIFQKKQVKWITGITTIYNDKSSIVNVKLPYKYRKNFINKGVYNGRYLPCIQQESTFWKKELMLNVDFDKLKGFRLAGDFYLWQSFSKTAKLDIVRAILSGFRKSKNQLSADMQAYLTEFDTIAIGKINVIDKFIIFADRVCGLFPIRVNHNIIRYDHEKELWL